MADTIFEISELQKKFTGFQEIPKGNERIAYVFFQSKDNSRYLITTEKRKIMAAELRMGKYDRIMTIYRGEFESVIRKNIACAEEGHYFSLELNVHYYIKNPEYIYKEKINQVSAELEKALFRIEFDLGGSYGFRENFKLEERLLELMDMKFKALDYLSIRSEIKIIPDNIALKIIEREQAHEINEHDSDLSTIEDRNQMVNQYDLEQMRLEREKEIASLTAEVNRLKVEGIGALFERYGANAGNLMDLAKGDLSGTRMSEILNQNKKDNLHILMQMHENGIMVDRAIENMIPSLILDNHGIAESGIGKVDINGSSVEGESSEEKDGSPAGGFQWNDSDKEDGMVE